MHRKSLTTVFIGKGINQEREVGLVPNNVCIIATPGCIAWLKNKYSCLPSPSSTIRNYLWLWFCYMILKPAHGDFKLGGCWKRTNINNNAYEWLQGGKLKEATIWAIWRKGAKSWEERDEIKLACLWTFMCCADVTLLQFLITCRIKSECLIVDLKSTHSSWHCDSAGRYLRLDITQLSAASLTHRDLQLLCLCSYPTFILQRFSKSSLPINPTYHGRVDLKFSSYKKSLNATASQEVFPQRLLFFFLSFHFSAP